jgi:hypothetical protein
VSRAAGAVTSNTTCDRVPVIIDVQRQKNRNKYNALINATNAKIMGDKINQEKSQKKFDGSKCFS